MDGKTALNQLCQRLCQRPLTKDDITYTTKKFGTQYQSIVKLVCLQGEQYAGETKFNCKEAEKSAALQALQAHEADALQLPPTDLHRKRVPKGPSLVAEGSAEDNPALTPKVKLNTLCMKIAHRHLKKGETLYHAQQVMGGFQATVQLICLPEGWSMRVWAGEVCATKQKAEQSAASIALAQISESDELRCIDERNAKGRAGKARKGGKGWGKGMSYFGFDWVTGWQSGPDLTREIVSDQVMMGDVVEWKDKFGWLKPRTVIDHPAAALHGGKVYISSKDLPDGAKELAAGTALRFQLYIDPHGLGAAEVAFA